MKKQLLNVSAIAMIGLALTFTSCSKEDTTSPELTLNGDATMTVPLNGTYTEPGATATDDEDGDLSAKIAITGDVDETEAGTYTVTYKVTDAAGNETTKTRTVYVAITVANLVGTYDVTDYVDPNLLTYQDDITASTTTGRLLVSKFAFYDNGGVYMDISGDLGTNVTIPQQDVTCGNPAALRTFSGYGYVSANGDTLIVDYTETVGTTAVTGTERYIRK